MRYCRRCDQAFNDDFMFCPKCASRLLSEAEVQQLNREKEKEIEAKRLMEEKEKQERELINKLRPIFQKYDDKGLVYIAFRNYYSTSAMGALDSASLSKLQTLYDLFVAHKERSKLDLYNEVDENIRFIRDKMKETERKIIDQRCDSIKVTLDPIKGWLDGGNFLCCEKVSGRYIHKNERMGDYGYEYDNYRETTYYYKKYNIPSGAVRSSMNDIKNGTDDGAGFHYLRLMYEAEYFKEYVMNLAGEVDYYLQRRNRESSESFISNIRLKHIVDKLEKTQNIKFVSNEEKTTMTYLGHGAPIW